MKRSLAALAAVAALSLAGCSPQAGTTTGKPAADAASSQPADASSGGPAAAGSVKVGDVVSTTELAARSTAAMSKAGTVKMTMTSSGSTMKGQMSFTGDAPEYALSGTAEDQTMEMVYVGKVLYMGGDSFKDMTGGKRFIKIDAKGDDAMSKMLAPLVSTIEQAANPASLLRMLDGVDSKVVNVDGGLVTYETTMTAKQLQDATEKMMGQKLDSADVADIKGVTMVQTMDAEGRLTKVTTKGADASEDLTITYTDYGAPVEISAPPASEIGSLDLSGLMPTPTTTP